MSKLTIVFIISFIATFMMVLIPHLKPKSTVFISPYVRPDIMDNIKQKLLKNNHSFKLKNEPTFIAEVKASSEYEQLESYVVLDFDTGQILSEKNSSQQKSIASLTKIMTAVVSHDLADPEDEFEVTDLAASQEPTKVMLKPGEKYHLKDLLAFLLMSSANDSAQVIKEGVDKKYGEEVFIKSMNEKAQILGLKNSHFTNPQGFDNPNHYSSAQDLATLSHYAINSYPLIAQIVSSSVMDKTQNGADNRFYLQNWNGLLGVYPGVSGLKTGNTEKALHTDIVISKREDKTILVVALGAPTVTKRDLWVSQLLDLGFGKVANLASVNVTEEQLKDKYSKWVYFQ